MAWLFVLFCFFAFVVLYVLAFALSVVNRASRWMIPAGVGMFVYSWWKRQQEKV